MINEINVYMCFARHETVTIDIDDGVTPLMIGCKHEECKFPALSGFYNPNFKDRIPEYAWYAPGTSNDLSGWEKEHVEKGGLLLGKINPNAPMLYNFVEIMRLKAQSLDTLHPLKLTSIISYAALSVVEEQPDSMIELYNMLRGNQVYAVAFQQRLYRKLKLPKELIDSMLVLLLFNFPLVKVFLEHFDEQINQQDSCDAKLHTRPGHKEH